MYQVCLCVSQVSVFVCLNGRGGTNDDSDVKDLNQIIIFWNYVLQYSYLLQIDALISHCQGSQS